MNLPKDFPELDKLQEKMNARIEPEIDMRLRVIGVNVTENNLKIENEIPIVDNRKVVLYIRKPGGFQTYRKLPKYHVRHCEKIVEMQQRGEYHKYFASTRIDGNFLLKLSNSDELSLVKLDLCNYCLTELKFQYGASIFPKKPKNFPLEDWFEPFFEYSSEDWKARSQSCRENANWTCSECNINLESHKHLLHTHHKWGTLYNDPEDLLALCIACHAKQDGGGHQRLKFYPDYNEFMTLYGEKWNLS